MGTVGKDVEPGMCTTDTDTISFPTTLHLCGLLSGCSIRVIDCCLEQPFVELSSLMLSSTFFTARVDN